MAVVSGSAGVLNLLFAIICIRIISRGNCSLNGKEGREEGNRIRCLEVDQEKTTDSMRDFFYFLN